VSFATIAIRLMVTTQGKRALKVDIDILPLIQVKNAVQKDFPNGSFPVEQCLNAKIKPTDKSSAKVTVVYLMECFWKSFSSDPKPSSYKCINENSEKIGNRYYEVTAIVSCLGKPNGFPCVAVDSIKNVTPKPSPPSPTPVGKWIDTPDIFVPNDIKKAALNYMVKNSKITSVAPGETSSKAYYGASTIGASAKFIFKRKIDVKGGVTYRVPAVIKTKSAAKGCNLPILSSDTTVDVQKIATGKYKFSKMTDVRTGKALREDSGGQPDCVGKAAWKKGVGKVNTYCKSVKGGCYSLERFDYYDS